MRRTLRLVSLAGSALAAVVFFAAGTPLSNADSNVQNFLVHVGWRHPPSALATRAADNFVQALAIVVGIICLSFVFDVWSKVRPKVGATQSWTASDTMRYMAVESRWARGLERFARYDADLSERWGKTVVERKNPWLLVPSEFVKEASKEGTPIRVIGTRSDNGVVELIEPHFWTSNIIGWHASTITGQESYTHPSIASMPRDSLVYVNLRIGQAGVRKTWPPVPLWLQLWDKVTAMKDDPNSRFNRLLRAILGGPAPSAPRSEASDQTSDAKRPACSSDTT